MLKINIFCKNDLKKHKIFNAPCMGAECAVAPPLNARGYTYLNA